MAGDVVLVNGNAYSFSSAILKINGVRYFGWSSITYGHKLEVGKGWGNNRLNGPRSRTGGKYTPDNVKMAWEKASAAQLRKDISALALDGISYGTVVIPSMTLQLLEPGTGAHIVTFLKPRLLVETGGIDGGTVDPAKEELEFDVMGLLIDGKSLADRTAL